MKTILKGTILLFSLIMLSCGGKDKEKREDGFSVQRKKAETEQPVATNAANEVKASERIDLTTKGIGPIKSIEIPAEIDQAMAAKGKEVYEQMCLACHRVGKKFIGPAPNGVLDRRTPEWVMNMILNPQEMVQQDPLAKDLLQEFNGSPMSNQGLTEEQARAIVEYFRTLK
ncbi:c-type cytochrome [Flagellimonas zhangzhouensis]|uniref:Cytochrome c, mono-and diheme variants n=1 Tax=Flagellimonas zhangzhouensis TaxID=1073328 RepID=A0A1H2QNB3_9FLAO|nr:cytochrome c [Allomuricauda zhangzhouensis]SDQ55181.1 Cytochrome c, mono-and diheme variants [Allomuricauda zhangzhouensis]SDW08652.1 Cytochrome c, mono-and diheme variants [Allomuricauda zhangzhouensis]